MKKICILDAITLGDDISLDAFNKLGDVVIYDTTLPEQVEERIKEAEIVITNKVVLNSANLINAKNLKLICITATGTNNIDLAYTRENNIAVTNVAGYSTKSVAQHTFALMFYLLENLKYFDNYVKSGEYIKSECFTHLGPKFYELDGKTWGIIGMGSIGRGVAKIAGSFGCDIQYYSTSGNNTDQTYKRVELDELLKTSDVVSIHAPLNENTRNLLEYQNMSLMKKSAILINVGRGGIVNEEDLVKILNEDKILGAGLDVLESEPMSEGSKLLEIKNNDKILITPHIAWGSVEARKRLMDEVLLNIESFYEGKKRNRIT